MAFTLRIHLVSVASILYVISYLVIYCGAVENKTAKPPFYFMPSRTFCIVGTGTPGMHGKPGIPGKPGTDGKSGTDGKPGSPGVPGRDGRDGREGAKGDQGSPGKTGPKGTPGPQGTPGNNGKDGAKGETGAQGPPGQKGQRGESGTSGTPGTPGVMPFKNWKECVWNSADSKDNGLIKDCMFTKNFSDTSLLVSWTGALRVYDCDICCKRWYFTFNGAECAGPMAIDGIVYMRKGKGIQDPHRVRHIEGHCNNIHKGRVRVGFWIGNCPGMGNADGHTGYKSVSRIYIEEVSKPQA